MMRMSGSLFIVPTPIGNLGDISFRAIEVLKKVSIIAAEDTRRTSILLRHYNIDKLNIQLVSFHEHNQESRTLDLINRMIDGESLALVSDAGTPLISDSGYLLISKAIEENINIVSLPGASAILTALTLSNFPLNEFLFLGFLPKKKNLIIKKFEEFKESSVTIILFESPKRIKNTLNILFDILGDRRVVVCRELTKIFEEIIRGKISELSSGLKDEIKGEITVVIEGATKKRADISDIKYRVVDLLKKGERVSAIADLLHKESGVSRKSIYSLAIKLNKK